MLPPRTLVAVLCARHCADHRRPTGPVDRRQSAHPTRVSVNSPTIPAGRQPASRRAGILDELLAMVDAGYDETLGDDTLGPDHPETRAAMFQHARMDLDLEPPPM